jgi:hypothetical protein
MKCSRTNIRRHSILGNLGIGPAVRFWLFGRLRRGMLAFDADDHGDQTERGEEQQ